MVTKAELEAQVVELRRQLDEKPQADTETPQDRGSEANKTSLGSENREHATDVSRAIEDLSGEFEKVLADLDNLPHKKSILFALGVFTLGYMIGRSK